MDDKYIFRRITYRKYALEGEEIKEVVVLGVNVGGRDLTSVINYPINGSPKYGIVFLDSQRQGNKEGIEKSGDWWVGKEISYFEKRKLNHLLEKK